MKLHELVEMLRRGILRDTSDAVSGDSDQLWLDSDLIRYIDEAQRRFARRSLCIRDGTSPVTRVPLVAYQQDYVLDPSVVAVYSVRNLGNGMWVNGVQVPTPPATALVMADQVDLQRTGHAERRAFPDPTGRAWYDTGSVARINPGRPLVFETDETMGTSNGSAGVVSLRLSPMPSEVFGGCVLGLRVARLPQVRLTPQNPDAIPEIPEDYHIAMLDYAAYLALRVADHEAGDAARAAEFQANFEKSVEEARVEIVRKAFVPLTWGFGGGGYTYTPN